MATTLLSNLINPEVFAPMVEKKLTDAIKFAPLAIIDDTLVGRPGDTLKFPSYSYIGDATVVAENTAITPVALSESSVYVTVQKIAKGVEITDEAALSGLGDPVDEAARQLALSIAAAYDNKFLDVLKAITGNMVYTATTFNGDAVADALVKFGEDIDGSKVLLVDPTAYATLRKANGWLGATDVAAERILRGVVGEIQGCQVVVTNKLAGENLAFIVKPGALRFVNKRDMLIESGRDIIYKKTIITADRHAAAYLYDASKAIKITIGG